jgi:hypothetical protein
VEVTRKEGKLEVRIVCVNRPGLLVDIMGVLESSRLTVLQASIACHDDILFEALSLEVWNLHIDLPSVWSIYKLLTRSLEMMTLSNKCLSSYTWRASHTELEPKLMLASLVGQGKSMWTLVTWWSFVSRLAPPTLQAWAWAQVEWGNPLNWCHS